MSTSNNCNGLCCRLYTDIYKTRAPSIMIDDTRFNLFDLGYRQCPNCNFFTAHYLQKEECRPINIKSRRRKKSWGKNTHCECCYAKFRMKHSVATKRAVRHRAKVLRREGKDLEEHLVMTIIQMYDYMNLVIH
jgi:hypothetical protein